MIDTHCHLTYDGLYERVDEVIANARAAGVDRFITVATSPDDADKAVNLAARFPDVFVAVGLHPHYSALWTDRSALIDSLRHLATNPRVVALGEMGLDRHYPDPPIEAQRRTLESQLELATELNELEKSAQTGRSSGGMPGVSNEETSPGGTWPIIIHNREATEDTLAMLLGSGLPAARFVFHCFTGSDPELDAMLNFGAMVGFTGIATFKTARNLAQAATRVPLERLLVETDSPYLTPEPHRKVKVNEPRFVSVVARFLAEARRMDPEEFIVAVDANARRFFSRMATVQSAL